MDDRRTVSKWVGNLQIIDPVEEGKVRRDHGQRVAEREQAERDWTVTKNHRNASRHEQLSFEEYVKT